SETVWRQADKYHVPRIAFANKMDKTGASFDLVLNSMKERLGAVALPVQWPMCAEDNFKGIIDLIDMKAYFYNDEIGQDITVTDVPAEYQELAEEKRNLMIERLADADDDVAMLFLEGEEIDADTLRAGIRRATIGLKL